ncbi:MAG: hypothetical protein JWP82_1170 [Humibacillus sp.]|nr:hypothetical protein [Humibacillus sp.]
MVEPVLAIVADDLSGAAESAAHAVMRVSRSIVRLSSVPSARAGLPHEPQPSDASTTVVTLDTDSRGLSASAAATAGRHAAAAVRQAPHVVKKVDSLLRGHPGVEVEALGAALGRHPVVAVANPALGRHVRDGVVHVHGTPLQLTSLWHLETTSVPVSVAQALAPLSCLLIPLATVRAGVDPLAEALRDARDRSLVAVCDGETDTDLDVVAAAARLADDRPLLVGSGALVDAVVRALDERPTPRPRANTQGLVGSLLAVLGSRAPLVEAQVAHARGYAAATVLLDPTDVLAGSGAVARVLDRLPRSGLVVVALDPGADLDPARSRELAVALARALSPVADRYDATFLTGGETARAVLDRLGVTELDVVAGLDPGTVLSRRPDGRLVVTRPGSFGDEQALTRVAQHLLGPRETSDDPDGADDASHAKHASDAGDARDTDSPSTTSPIRQASPTTEENS